MGKQCAVCNHFYHEELDSCPRCREEEPCLVGAGAAVRLDASEFRIGRPKRRRREGARQNANTRHRPGKVCQPNEESTSDPLPLGISNLPINASCPLTPTYASRTASRIVLTESEIEPAPSKKSTKLIRVAAGDELDIRAEHEMLQESELDLWLLWQEQVIELAPAPELDSAPRRIKSLPDDFGVHLFEDGTWGSHTEIELRGPDRGAETAIGPAAFEGDDFASQPLQSVTDSPDRIEPISQEITGRYPASDEAVLKTSVDPIAPPEPTLSDPIVSLGSDSLPQVAATPHVRPALLEPSPAIGLKRIGRERSGLRGFVAGLTLASAIWFVIPAPGRHLVTNRDDATLHAETTIPTDTRTETASIKIEPATSSLQANYRPLAEAIQCARAGKYQAAREQLAKLSLDSSGLRDGPDMSMEQVVHEAAEELERTWRLQEIALAARPLETPKSDSTSVEKKLTELEAKLGKKAEESVKLRAEVSDQIGRSRRLENELRGTRSRLETTQAQLHETQELYKLAIQEKARALQQIDELQPKGPDAALERYRAGLESYQRRDYPKAELRFAEAVHADGQDARYHYLLGFARRHQEKLDKAEESFREGARLEREHKPSPAFIHVALEKIDPESLRALDRIRTADGQTTKGHSGQTGK